MELTQLQRNIMQYSKDNYFKVRLDNFLGCNPEVNEEDAIAALRELKSKRICAVGPDIRTSFIGATNMGWKAMGWTN